MNCPSCDSNVLPGDDICRACGTDLVDVGVPEPKLGKLHEVILLNPLSELNALPPITLAETDTVAHAAEMMRKHRYGSVLIVDSDGTLKGIFTERDLLSRLESYKVPFEHVRLKEVMTPDPQSLEEDDTVGMALNRMAVGGYRHVPVVRAGRAIGFVSIRGLLRYIVQNALAAN